MTWVDIPFYEGLYKINERGDVKTFYGKKGGKEYILKPHIDKDGYEEVTLYKDGKYKHFRVHRLVASVFVPNPDKKPIVNHIDTNRRNNYYLNLEWVTNLENVLHSKNLGHMTGPNKKSVIATNKNGDSFIFKSISEACRKLNVHAGNVVKVCKGQRHSANGYFFKYEIEEME